MNRRILLLNAVLALGVIQGARTFRTDWLQFESTHRPSLIKTNGEKTSGVQPRPAGAAAPPSDWTEIASKNPFSFDRNENIVAAAVETKPVDMGPKPILFGTAFLGKEPIAMIGSGRAPSRAFRPMKAGEAIDGWVLERIEAKTVVVMAGEKRETLIMNDPTAAVPRDSTKTVTTQPPVQPPVPQPSSTASPPPVNVPGNQGPPAPTAPAYAPGAVIRTPFGDIRIPDQK